MDRSITVVLVAVAALAGRQAQAQSTPPAAAAHGPATTFQEFRGKLLERIDVAQYSYLRIGTAGGEVWAAVTRTDRKPGEDVVVQNAYEMRDFQSKELKRKFDVIYFGGIAPAGGSQALPPEVALQHKVAATGPTEVKLQKVTRAPGASGRTVEELWSDRARLAGKSVAVRAQVVRATAVLGKNFLHLRDGSGSEAARTNDLPATTADEVPVGSVVTVTGKVVLDKDFGSGYRYQLLLEDAKVVR